MEHNQTAIPEPLPALLEGDPPGFGIFPQKFTPFELYFLLEDRPDYPSVFPVRLECRGALDRECFERAFQLAHGRHPLLSARIQHDRRGWPIWVAGEPEPIRWSEGSESFRAKRASSASKARLQLDVLQSGDATVLSFLFDHVAVDGMGAFQFIADLMVAYAHGCSGDVGPPPLRTLDHQLLRSRDGYRLPHGRSNLVNLARTARIAGPLLFRRAAVVSDHGQGPTPCARVGSAPDFLLHTFSERETAELSRTAGKLEVRLHALLLRDYFLTLADWNADTPESRRPIRILVPTNLRRKQDYWMPAANVFGYAFLTRSASQCGDRAGLLDFIRNEMAAIKRDRRALYYEAGLRRFAAWPRLLRWSLERKWPFATAIFSNLNAGFDHLPLPWREGRRVAGDLIVESGYGSGPIRPETRLALAVHSYAGKMSLCVRCDKLALGDQQQRDLVRAYLDRLRETIDSAS